MTVTPIHSRPGPRRPRATARGGSAAPAAHPDADNPEGTLTVEVRVSGAADPDALALIRDLQRLVGRNAGPVRVAGWDPRLVRIDPAARSVIVGTRAVALSRLEFDLLLHLAEHPDRAHSREDLLRQVWHDEGSGTRTVDVHVRRLRAKTGEIPLITTVRNTGYRLADDARVDVVR